MNSINGRHFVRISEVYINNIHLPVWKRSVRQASRLPDLLLECWLWLVVRCTAIVGRVAACSRELLSSLFLHSDLAYTAREFPPPNPVPGGPGADRGRNFGGELRRFFISCPRQSNPDL